MTAREAVTCSPAEAAERVGVSEWWIRNEVRHARIPHHRFGRTVRFTDQDVADIIRMCRQPAKPSAGLVPSTLGKPKPATQPAVRLVARTPKRLRGDNAA